MNRISTLIITVVTFTFFLTSCDNDKDLVGGMTREEQLADIAARFDFTTTIDCPVTIEGVGRRALVTVYDSESYEVFSAFTSEDGSYDGTATFATAQIGQTLTARCANWEATAKLTAQGIYFYAQPSRSDFYDSRSMEDEVTESARLSNLFIDRMKEGKNNFDKISITNDNSNLLTQDDNTEVKFSFVHSGGRFMTQVYYYYYKEDKTTEAVYQTREAFLSQFKNEKFLATNGWGCKYTEYNAASDEGFITGGDGWINRNFKNCVGASNMLLFYGENYDKDGITTFPAGYRIGFFLVCARDYANSAHGTQNGGTVPYDNAPRAYYFTEPWLNPKAVNFTTEYEGNGGTIETEIDYRNIQAAYFLDAATDGSAEGISRVVYGFEDTPCYLAYNGSYCDHDYNDMMFMISTNPKIDESKITSLESSFVIYNGTLLYEDLYPNQGDYDINDVIIEYKIKKDFDWNNKITDMTCSFTALFDGATYDDGFYLSIPGVLNTDYCSIFEHIKNSLNTTVSFTLSEAKGKNIGDVTWTHFNPFIYVKDTNREVHLPKKPFSGKGSEEGLDEYAKAYISRPEDKIEFPFAMNIPVARSESSYNPGGFTPVTESVKIWDEYPDFLGWVSSSGSSNTNWYRNYQKK